MKRKCFAVLAPFVFSAFAFGQGPQMPKPAPELKKLDYFVGSWKTEADMKPNPYGPGGKITGSDKVQWMEGNFFLIVHSRFSGSMGSGLELAAMGYDPAKKVYTYNSFNSMGERDSATGTVEGDTWTWNSDPAASMNGMKWRFTQKILSPSSYSMKFEVSPDGSAWSTVMEGKATKMEENATK